MVEPLFCNIDDKSIVYRSVSELFNVCTYFIVDSHNVIVVDPGKLSQDVCVWLESFQYLNKIIYITHEHFDHHYDVIYLLSFPNTSVFVPSSEFEMAVTDTRTNLSHYYNSPIQSNLNKKSKVDFFKVIPTPGHSRFSFCFKYKNILFGGDTLINAKYLVLKLPRANKSDYKESIKNLNNLLELDTVVLPGHGELFCFDKIFI